MIKCKEDKSDLQSAISAWRNVAREDGITPSQAFFGRRQKQNLPLRQPDLPIKFENKDLIASDQAVRRDLHTQQLPLLQVGQEVVLQHHLTHRWDIEAVITRVRDNGASYYVKTKQGRDLLRGRRLIRPAPPANRAPVLNTTRRLQVIIMSSSQSPILTSDPPARPAGQEVPLVVIGTLLGAGAPLLCPP